MPTKKTAKKAAKKKGGKGKRYSASAKEKIISFVNEVNEAKGRGGVAAASRKFKVSPLSINTWIKKGGGGSNLSAGNGRRRSAGGGRDGVLQELTSLNRDISKKRSELDKLEARFDKLKASL